MREQLIKWVIKLITLLIILIINMYVEMKTIEEAIIIAAFFLNMDKVVDKFIEWRKNE